MQLSPSNILQIVIFTQMLFACLLLVGKPRFTSLVLLTGTTALLMAFNLLEETGLTSRYYLVTPAFSLIKGPLFYLVVSQAIDSDFKLDRNKALHFTPALLGLAFTSWPQLVLFFGSISAISYFALCIRKVSYYHKLRVECRSDAQEQQLAWLSGLLAVMVSFSLVDLIRLNLQPYLPHELLFIWYFIMQFGFFAIISFIVLKALRQPELFSGLNTLELDLLQRNEAQKNDSEASSIFKELDERIRSEQLYRQARLSLRDLNEISGLNERDISWAINTGGGLNFCDYINRLRVQEVEATLRQNIATNSHQPLIDIALNTGFNSKSTFNASFKRETGQTPSQYLRGLTNN
jgi:AraC-like DNA-binding protein